MPEDFRLEDEASGQLNAVPACPRCSRELDGFNTIGAEGGPKEGDWSICAYCAAVNRFGRDEGGKLCLITPDPDDPELIEVMKRPEMQHAQAVVLELWQLGGLENKRSSPASGVMVDWTLKKKEGDDDA